MKTYLVEVEDVVCIVRADTKAEAAMTVENRFSIAFVNINYVKKLPKKGIIHEQTRPHHHHKIRDI